MGRGRTVIDDGDESAGRTPKDYYPNPRFKVRLADGLARLLRQCSCVVGPEVENEAMLDLVTTFVVVHCDNKRLKEVVDAAADRIHRDRVGERTKEVLRERREKGLPVGGDAVYGYEKAEDGATLIPVEAEQEAIRIAKELRSQGKSYARIADELAKGGHFNRKGVMFAPTSIVRMVRGSR